MNAAFLSFALCLGQSPADASAVINQELAAYQRKHKITPSARCADHEFLRRASLDLIGRIPTMAEIDVYFKDDVKTRRPRLIDRLVSHPESPRHWADLWTHWLIGAIPPGEPRSAFHGWLEEHFAKNRSHKELAEQLLVAKGLTRDNPAGYFLSLLRGLPVPEKQHAAYGAQDMIPATNQIVQVFLGRHIACVQCHDHPFNDDMSQHHFWAANLFLRQVEFMRVKIRKDLIDEIRDNPKLNESALAPYERRNGVLVYTQPKLFDGPAWTKRIDKSRRQFLAEQLVARPEFAQALPHRLWTFLLGRGLTQHAEFDDVGEHNPIIHKRILARLAGDFRKAGHDPRVVLRVILATEAYHASSVANPTNTENDAALAFARMQLRPLTNEQIVESVLTATLPKLNAAERGVKRETLRKLLFVAPRLPTECAFMPTNLFGDITQERALFLSQADAVHLILSGDDALPALVAREHPKVNAHAIEKLFLHTLTRPPTKAELANVMRVAEQTQKRGANLARFPRTFYEDVFWALINTAEFGMNH